MRMSINWLKEYVDLEGVSPQELAQKLTIAGLEVEGIETMAQASGLVIGRVLTCEDHPDSDHLHVTTVDVGAEVLQIVCGAPNVRAGQKVIVSRVGAVLAGGLQIKPTVIRGQQSNGMICSLSELGVDKKWQTEQQLAGIYEVDESIPVGESEVLKALGLDDTILDIGLTPNRADCNAMWNIAMEVGAVLHRPVRWPDCQGAAKVGVPGNFRLSSKTDKCPLFIGKVVNHVKVGPSPKWLQNALHAAGIKSINNVVDISNYVMVETGHPLHYYDLKKLPHHEITVVDDVEMTMQALDGQEYEIRRGDLLITTGGVPTGIAGILGGEESKIDENTTSIFIEAADFNAVSIRNTARRLGLNTEAASRFIKGVEPLAAIKAVDRSVQLLSSLAEARDFEETLVVGELRNPERTVTETLSHCNQLLGTSFTMEQVVGVLNDLNLNPQQQGDQITCTIPSYRTNLNIREDLDEEIIRLLGYEGLKTTLPQMKATVGQLSDRQQLRRTLQRTLNAMGLSEIITYTLVSKRYIDHGLMPLGEAIELASPMSEERRYVRTSLLMSLLECLAYNQNHKNEDVNLFEISHLYADQKQQERLAMVMAGNLQSSRLHRVQVSSDFFTMKGVLMEALEKLGFSAERIEFRQNDLDQEHFHPYRSACVMLDRKLLGVMGEIHPSLARQLGVSRAVAGEFNLELLLESKAGKVRFTAMDRFPAVHRDVALVVREEVQAQQLIRSIKAAGRKLVREVEVFDVYQGEHVEAGSKSVALSITYQSGEQTLTDQQIQSVHQSVLERLKNDCGAVLRG